MSPQSDSKTQVSHYDWIWYTKGFLAVANAGIQRLQQDGYVKMPYEDKLIYEYRQSIIGILWCIRHSIELIFKTLSIASSGRYQKTHKLSDLQKSLPEVAFKSKIERYKELVSLSEKYRDQGFWQGRLKNIIDLENESFRYPEGKRYTIDVIGDKILDMQNEELWELERDIKRLEELLAILYVNLAK